MSARVWSADKGAVVTGGARLGVYNSHGRPGVAIAAEVVAAHNGEVQQLLADVSAGAAQVEQLRRELAEVRDTRNRAQAEATRQVIARQDLIIALRKALRLAPAGDVLATVYRLQRLADAARAVVRGDDEARS